MANFRVHLGTSMIISSALSTPLILTEITIPNLIITFFIGMIGGMLPDIDSDNSKSISIIFTLFAVIISILFIFQKYEGYSLLNLSIIAISIFIFIRYIIINIFRKFTKHRGMFHSIPVAFLWGISLSIIVNSFFNINSFTSWVFAVILIITYISHLILDEIYSVDLRGIRMKKSFGTALKFYQNKTLSNKVSSLMIYFFLISLYFFTPSSVGFINQIKMIPENYKLKKVLIKEYKKIKNNN